MTRILYLGLDPTHYQAQKDGQITHWPIIRIVPRPLTDPSIQHALAAFDNYSHVIFTSKSAVAILHDYLNRFGIPLESWAAKMTLAVGQVTAKHLGGYGIKASIVSQEETAEGLLNELQQLPLKQAHLFWPHSAQARSVIRDFFIDQGIRYTACPLYDTETYVPGSLPNLSAFDEIVFTSPSTIKAFLEIFGQLPTHLLLTSIGPVTASFLAKCKRLPN